MERPYVCHYWESTGRGLSLRSSHEGTDYSKWLFLIRAKNCISAGVNTLGFVNMFCGYLYLCHMPSWMFWVGVLGLWTSKAELGFVVMRVSALPSKWEKVGLCMVLCCIEDYFLLFPIPYQIRQRVHQILNMRGSSIKIVRHILKGELRYSYACASSLPGTARSSLCRMSVHM